MIRRSVGLLLAGIGVLMSHALVAQAADAPQNITLSPSSTELSALPGGSDQGTVDVINGGSTSFKFKVYTDAYSVTGLTYDPSFTPLPGHTDPSSWIHFTGPTTATIGSGQSVSVPYTLQIPAGTAPGGYYAVIFAETLPDASTGVTSHSRVGDILYITAQGTVTESGTVKPTHLSPFVIGSSLPLSAQVENNGGLHFVSTVHLSLVNPLTKRAVYTADLQRYVLPQTTRQIGATAQVTAPIGIYKEEVSADILGQTQTLPTRWVVVVHPIVLLAIPIIIILIIIYIGLPKTKDKSKKPAKTKVRGS